MPGKRAKKASPRKPRRAAARRAAATKRAEEKVFIESLVAHGQAVAVRPGDKLPPGATHELIKKGGRTVKVVRKRFSAF